MRHLAPALALIAAFSCSDATPATEPHVALVDFAGLEPALEGLRGEGTLLNFWATWCPPCVAELPELVEVGKEFAERGGRVVGISYDFMVDTGGADGEAVTAAVRDFLVQRGLALDSLVYDEVDYDTINELFDLPGEIPVTLALDKHGRIVDRHHGKADRARFEELMRKALGL